MLAAASRLDNRYDVRELLGVGGVGVVYKAWDSQSNVYVALKIMKCAADPPTLSLFEQQWKTLASLSHPNIAAVIGSGACEQEGRRTTYVVMPLLPGTSLDRLIRESSHRLTTARVVDILVQACRGLQAAHAQNLVHRDLRPSNLFVLPDDSVKIVDFGMILPVESGKTGAAGRGALPYMAPEQIEMKDVTAATDIYTLGVVAYEAFTGVQPFERGTASATVQAIRDEFPSPVSEINPAVNSALGQVVAKAMAKGPRNRFSSAREFAEYLQKALQDGAAPLFGNVRIQPRLERARRALRDGDLEFAHEILSDLQTETPTDSEIGRLLGEVKQAAGRKAVRELLSSARMRLEESEFALAWQKVQEVIQKDPGDREAQALLAEIETRRSEQQSERLRGLVRDYLHDYAFTEARQTIEEIRKVQRDELAVADLIAEADRLEDEFRRFCEEEEKRYQSAMRAYDNGDIGASLSKLVKLLGIDSRTPVFPLPGRDAVYRETYNRIRTELEAAQRAITEIEQVMAAGNLARAAEMAREQSEKYPYDFGLQAFKLKIDDQLRQEKWAYIAEAGRRVEAEPDLNQKLALLDEALERYPKEPHLRELANSLRMRLDMVGSMAVRARQYEDENLLDEALGQWNSLRSIYSHYPELDAGIQRVQLRLEQQRREERRLNRRDQIDGCLKTGDYERAQTTAADALAEFSGDEELLSLQRQAVAAQQRSREGQELTQQARALCAEGSFAQGIELLRRASGLDPNNSIIRDELASVLAGRAQALLTDDWRAADLLIQEALHAAPANALAKSLRPSVLLAKRLDFVDRSVAQARDLQAAGDLSGALAAVHEALAAYPHDSRLIQLQNTLRSALAKEASLRRRRKLEERRQLTPQPERGRAETQVTGIIGNKPAAAAAPRVAESELPTVIADTHREVHRAPPQAAREFPLRPGLYRSSENGFTKLELATLSGAHEGAGLGKILVKRSKNFGYLVGLASKMRMPDPQPVFYLRLAEGESMPEFVLAAFETKGDRRRIEFGSGPRPLFKPAAIRPFASHEISPHLFALSISKLIPGEYVLFLTSSADMPHENYGKGYDFGIDEPHS